MTPTVRFIYVGPELPFSGMAALQQAVVDGHRWLEQKASRRCAIQGIEIYPHDLSYPLTNETVWPWAIATQAREYPNDHVVFLVRGAGGFAGGNVAVKTAVLGDWCLDELIGLSSDRNGVIFSRDAQIGAMLHEMLHLFGVDHEEGGIMRYYWDWPRCALPEKAIANDELFGAALPVYVRAWRWIRFNGLWRWRMG